MRAGGSEKPGSELRWWCPMRCAAEKFRAGGLQNALRAALARICAAWMSKQSDAADRSAPTRIDRLPPRLTVLGLHANERVMHRLRSSVPGILMKCRRRRTCDRVPCCRTWRLLKLIYSPACCRTWRPACSDHRHTTGSLDCRRVEWFLVASPAWPELS